METLFLGKKYVNLDSKGRIFIPADFNLKSGTEIAFAKFSDNHSECDYYYELYLLEKINKLIDELMKKRDFVIEEAEYKLIVKKLNTLYNLIVDTAKLDSQRRISLPQDVRERVDNNRILLQGKGESIALFPNDYSYNYYCEENLEKGLRI